MESTGLTHQSAGTSKAAEPARVPRPFCLSDTEFVGHQPVVVADDKRSARQSLGGDRNER